jgi:hypothetical protein
MSARPLAASATSTISSALNPVLKEVDFTTVGLAA